MTRDEAASTLRDAVALTASTAADTLLGSLLGSSFTLNTRVLKYTADANQKGGIRKSLFYIATRRWIIGEIQLVFRRFESASVSLVFALQRREFQHLMRSFSLNRTSNNTHSLCSDQFLAPRRKTFGVTVFSPRKCSKITKIAVSRSVRIRTRTRPIQTHHGRTRQRLTARAVAEATTSEFHERMEPSHVKTTHSSSFIGNPLFKRWLAHPAVNAVGKLQTSGLLALGSGPDSHGARPGDDLGGLRHHTRTPPAQDRYTTLKDAIVARPSRTRPIRSSLHSYSAPSSLETRSHRSFYCRCRCVRSPAHERQTTSYAYAGLTCCPTQRDGCSRSSKTRPLMSSRRRRRVTRRRTLGDCHRSWTTALETGIARRRCLFKFKFSWSAGNRRAPRCDRPTEQKLRAKLSNVEIILEVALARELNHARSHDLAHQHRIEARPRGTAGTTRDTATWAEQCRGSRVCSHPKARQEN
ncbi:unnamed protein product [Trichogramma brassicae]|uniref:Uncharacterized protein n=1 Tax=Trichogramma brassicae TaxID=86971 RepID=A0A6H5I2B1_9HYME|nr:unnamed protein product [Trichogramma brassicae]